MTRVVVGFAWKRWVALVVSTVSALLVVEFGLRQAYPRLPSVDALRGSEYRIEQLVDLAGEAEGALCHEVRSFLSHRSRWGGTGGASGVHFPVLSHLQLSDDGHVLSRGRKAAETHGFWVAGDSLAFGLGVNPAEAFGTLLAHKLSVDRDWLVEHRNLAVPGAGFCTAVQRVASVLKRHPPELVLLVLSADDLEERLMLQVQGELVVLPDLVANRMWRWAVKRSWFANLIWFRWTSVREVIQTGQERFIGRQTRLEFQTAMVGIKERIERKGGRLVVAMVPPPGMPRCTDANAQKRCAWLQSDMRLMLDLLAEAGVESVDLRGMWPGLDTDIVPRERSVMRGGRLAMHPSVAGHRKLAEKLWPHVAKAR